MGLASEMKNLSEEILASFRQRIQDNEELVNEVQKTLDGFRKDHQEMAATLAANAASLRKELASGEKERLNIYTGLMAGIHDTIISIQKEVLDIQSSTGNMISEFTIERGQMAGELSKFFAEGRADRMQDEKVRLEEFDTLMKEINDDIKTINEEVADIFKSTNDLLDRFEKEHNEMSAELRAGLSKNLAERVQYTKVLLNGFQKRLSEITRENQKMAQKLRKDLASGESHRMSEYTSIMKGIQVSIKGIRKEVDEIKKGSSDYIGELSQDRGIATKEWNKMQAEIDSLKKGKKAGQPKQTAKKIEKKEVLPEIAKPLTAKEEVTFTSFPEEPKTLEQKVLEYINGHPKGVKISEMEEPLHETRMKLGYVAKVLLDEGKVQKNDNIYFPLK